MRTLPAATALAVLFSAAALAVAPTASADSAKPFPLSDWADDTVVDGVHQQVFLSDGGKVIVADYAGNVVKTLTGLPGVNDLELSPDSGTLYATAPEADKIVAVDTATLALSAEYPTGEKTAPHRVAYADGKLWFGWGQNWDSGIGAVDLTAETPTVNLDLAAGYDWSGRRCCSPIPTTRAP